MSNGDSYWDTPAVQAAEAEYEAAAKAAAEAKEQDRESKALDEAAAKAKRKLDHERRKWSQAHPGQEPPWRGAGGDDVLGPVPRDPWKR